MKRQGRTNKSCKECNTPIENVHTSALYCARCAPIVKRARKNEYERSWRPWQQRSKKRVVREIKPDAIGVYISYDINGQIIYVGRTKNIGERLFRHERQKSLWLNESVKIEFIPYETFGDSLVAESVLIRDHRPKFNKNGVTS